MKIIIGSESYAPNISGVAVSAEALARYLVKAGHEVYVFAPSQNFQNHTEKTDHLNIIRLKSFPNPFRKGFRIALLPKKEIARAVSNIKPDLIHLQDPTSICSALLKTGLKQHTPIIITNHFSLDYILSYVRYLRPLHPLLRSILMRHLSSFYNRCQFVICPTETVRSQLKHWGVNVPIQAISNGVDINRFFTYSSAVTLRLKYHLPSVPIVLYLGRIDKDKSIDVLIEAIPEVIKRTDAHFVLAGSGDEVAKMTKKAEKLGVRQFVTFTGRIEHESPNLEKLYQIAAVFAIPSAIETQSIVTLEAMAAGLPIIGAKAGALPELIKPDQNGFLFPPGDSHELAKYLIKVITNKNLRSALSKKSLEIVSNHQISSCFTRVQAIYEQVIQNSRQ